MALDPRIEVIREQYGLDKSDFWELPQKKGTWLVKHAALEMAAAKAGIVFDNPIIIEAASVDGVAVISVRGELPPPVDKNRGQSEWSIGEASPKNNKNAYPWAMAEKRAKDRVILKLIGIHGLVYSEDEMPDNDERAPRHVEAEAPPARTLVKDQRVIWTDLRDEIDSCATVEELATLWVSKLFQTEMKKLKDSWQKLLVEHKDDHKAILMGEPPTGPRIAPDFDKLEARQ